MSRSRPSLAGRLAIPLTASLLSLGARAATVSAVVAAVSVAVPLSLAAQANGTDIVRGRVKGPDGKPVGGAAITVSDPANGLSRTTRTDAKGSYTVLVPDGGGDYVVSVRAIGFKAEARRVTRLADEEVLIADVALAATPGGAATALDKVVVTEQRDRRKPPRTNGDESSIGGDAKDLPTGDRALLSDPTDLASLAALMPGVQFLPGADGQPNGFSVLGAGADQNTLLVDGSNFGGGSLPQDALGRARLATSSFDPSRGQFSGALMTVTTRGGSVYPERKLRLRLDDPRLMWADATANAFQPPSQTQGWSGSLGGPIRRGPPPDPQRATPANRRPKAFYLAAFQVDRTASDLQSILSAADPLLNQYGLARDSISHLSSLLGGAGIPMAGRRFPAARINGSQSGFVKLDASPTATTSLSLRLDGRWQQRGAGGTGPLNFPAYGNSSRSANGGAQLSASTYFGKGFLNETRAYVTLGTQHQTPYVSLPSGRVLVTSQINGGRGLTGLTFGGNPAGYTSGSTQHVELTNETSWFSLDSKHKFKFSGNLISQRSSNLSATNPYGVFTFASLADLESNRPSSFSRTLDVRERDVGGLSAAASLGDSWRATERVQVQYGLRLDAMRPAIRPAFNPLVDSVFGRRTDFVPSDLGLSPRLGFSWTIGKNPTREEVALARARNQPFFSSLTNLSGGVGLFHGLLSSDQVASAATQTGLPDAIRQLTCAGAATPVPDWTQWTSDLGSLPDHCLDGTAPATFSSNRPRVLLFDRNYAAPSAWRANVSARRRVWRSWSATVAGTYSLGVQQASSVDLNLRRTPAFTLPDENGRPVLADAQSIVPATGVVAPGAARIDPRFDRVTSNTSDLRSRNTQVTVSLSPSQPLFKKLPLNVSYTHSTDQRQTRGFGGSTAGDPFAVEWGRGNTATHQFIVGTSLRVKLIALNLYANATSGMPYTPMIGSDMNGDGGNNDRAFVFDPNAPTLDAALATQMRSLMASAAPATRRCLESQLGHIAGRNSCIGRWRVQPNIGVSFDPSKNFTLKNKLRFSLLTVNAFSAVNRLVAPNHPLALLNPTMSTDPVLLYVRGFDPATRRYVYQVNQNFGERTGARGVSQYNSPFRLILQAELNLGGPPRFSYMRMLGLTPAPAKGKPKTVVTVDAVKARLSTMMAQNLVTQVLARGDSLALTGMQRAHLDTLKRTAAASIDSITTPLASYLAERGERADDAETGKRMSMMQTELRKRGPQWMAEVKRTLTPEQWLMLPVPMRALAPDAAAAPVGAPAKPE